MEDHQRGPVLQRIHHQEILSLLFHLLPLHMIMAKADIKVPPTKGHSKDPPFNPGGSRAGWDGVSCKKKREQDLQGHTPKELSRAPLMDLFMLTWLTMPMNACAWVV